MSYAALAAVVLLLAAAVAVLAGRRAGVSWWVRVAAVAAVLVALTAVFDNLMIALDLYRYAEAGVSGIRLGLAPLEDFAWPLVAALLLPGLWELLGPRRPSPGSENPAPAPEGPAPGGGDDAPGTGEQG